MNERNTVSVQIYGQEYSISADMPREYIIKLADYVDGKMKEIGENGSMPMSSVAVLTAVNMADEYFCLMKEVGDYKKYEQMWDEVKASFAQCKQDLADEKQRSEELQHASADKDRQLAELYTETADLKKHNEVLRGRVTELTGAVEQAQGVPEEANKRIAELEAKCRDTESSFFDIQMENIRLKNEVDALKKQLGRF